MTYETLESPGPTAAYQLAIKLKALKGDLDKDFRNNIPVLSLFWEFLVDIYFS